MSLPDQPEPRPTRHLTLDGNTWRFVDVPAKEPPLLRKPVESGDAGKPLAGRIKERDHSDE